jgi:hypothetical protein
MTQILIYVYITRYSKHYTNLTLDSSAHTLYMSKTEPASQTLITAAHDTTGRMTHHHKVSTHSIAF